MQRQLLLVLVIIYSIFPAMAQRVENVDFKINDNAIIVTYDIVESPGRNVYDIRLVFKTDAGNEIIPKNPAGDLKDVSPGKGKQIIWRVFEDNQEVRGNISAVVEIVGRHKLPTAKIIGGPGNAFLSMLLPGLGDHFVNKYAADNIPGANETNNKYWYAAPAIFYLCAYAAFTQYSKYKENYASYRSATDRSLMDRYYSEANSQYQTYQLYAGAAASAWVFDVVSVAIRGFKNKKFQLDKYAITEHKTRYYIVATGQDFQFGFVHKF